MRERDDENDEPVQPEVEPRARKVLVLVVAAVLIATVVLCCVAVGEAGQLFWLELPPP